MNGQLDLFPTSVHLPGRNMWRFYAMRVERDLFSEWCLVREWGRIGSPGRVKKDWFHGAGQALDALAKLAKAKQSRGYSASELCRLQ